MTTDCKCLIKNIGHNILWICEWLNVQNADVKHEPTLTVNLSNNTPLFLY